METNQTIQKLLGLQILSCSYAEHCYKQGIITKEEWHTAERHRYPFCLDQNKILYPLHEIQFFVDANLRK